ncbi:MAG: L,D-transpeptidase family protein [Chloroflexi bacterium]|nr:L,D-transpeptidase family protein [Chloroflexota bacterium]MBU1747494.1 L,D-transpeptidase family protein [Chloroflexota bacterium]MBU1879036.1 L,D-transpeptidase family protein [Chloroflexota bacterium]
MTTPEPGSNTASILVERGREALRAGDRRRARRYFTTAVAAEPACVAAWRGLAGLADEPQMALEYLQRALALAPKDPGLLRAIQQAQASIQREEAPTALPQSAPRAAERAGEGQKAAPPAPGRPARRRWLLVGALVVLAVVAGMAVIAVLGFTVPGLLVNALTIVAPVSAASVDAAPVTGAPVAGAPAAVARAYVVDVQHLVVAGEEALAEENWPRALALLTVARRIAPQDPGVESALYEAALDWGYWLAAQGRYTAAGRWFAQAQAVGPDNLEPVRAGRLATALRRARYAMLREDWPPAIAVLTALYDQDPAQAPVAQWLYEAYCQHGQALEAQRQWTQAQAAYASALKVRPGGTVAQQGLTRVRTKLPAQPPAAPSSYLTGKWIDVSLTRQTLTAYQGQVPVLFAVVSTGKQYTPTPTGQFAIQRKYLAVHMSGPGYSLPNVPYSMFFVGGYAIHGTYWHSNFGTPMSHGCINMRTDQAKWLYDWAPVGTPVVIHP